MYNWLSQKQHPLQDTTQVNIDSRKKKPESWSQDDKIGQYNLFMLLNFNSNKAKIKKRGAERDYAIAFPC